MCVWGGGGGDEAISKLKGAGQRMPSHAHTCMCPFYSAPHSTQIICAAHRRSRPDIIGRHLKASN